MFHFEALLSSARRHVKQMSSSPSASIIVNTYNRADSLAATLHSLGRLNYPAYEIIVVNGPSTDNTIAVMRAHANTIRAGSCSERNLSISRNVGIEMARGDLLAFLDDDAVAHPDWLADAAKAFDHEEVGGVGGFVFGHTGYDLQFSYSLCDRMGNAYHDTSVPLPELCYPGSFRYPALLGTNSIFRRSALLEIGGFDEQYDYFLDETDVDLRLVDAGYVLKQIPRAFIYHRYLPSHIRNEARININYRPIVRNRIYFSLKNAPNEPGYAIRLLKDWARLATEAEFNVKHHIAQGNIEAGLLQRFQEDLDLALREGLAAGLTPERRLIGSEFSRKTRGAVTCDIFDREHAGEFKPCTAAISSQGKLSVCLLSQQYPPGVVGGIGRLTHDLACGLADSGHDVHVLTKSASAGNRVDYERGVWVHRLVCDREEDPPPPEIAVPPHIWQYSARLLRELRRINEMHAVDIVEAPIWDTEGIAAVVAGDFPVVTNLETPWKIWRETNCNLLDNTPEEDQFFRDQAAAEVLVMERSTAIRGISQAIVETMKKHYGVCFRPGQVSVVPLGMRDRSVNSPSYCASEKGAINILFAGRLERRKGVGLAVGSDSRALPEFPARSLRIRWRRNRSAGWYRTGRRIPRASCPRRFPAPRGFHWETF